MKFLFKGANFGRTDSWDTPLLSEISKITCHGAFFNTRQELGLSQGSTAIRTLAVHTVWIKVMQLQREHVEGY